MLKYLLFSISMLFSFLFGVCCAIIMLDKKPTNKKGKDMRPSAKGTNVSMPEASLSCSDLENPSELPGEEDVPFENGVQNSEHSDSIQEDKPSLQPVGEPENDIEKSDTSSEQQIIPNEESLNDVGGTAEKESPLAKCGPSGESGLQFMSEITGEPLASTLRTAFKTQDKTYHSRLKDRITQAQQKV